MANISKKIVVINDMVGSAVTITQFYPHVMQDTIVNFDEGNRGITEKSFLSGVDTYVKVGGHSDSTVVVKWGGEEASWETEGPYDGYVKIEDIDVNNVLEISPRHLD